MKMTTKMPKLSIITINLNNKEGLEKTIHSIVSQKFNDYEWIVIDGGSNDGSLEVLSLGTNRLKGTGHSVMCVSERDSGIYNAMNKGIGFANGEYCLFLNSGDWLYDAETLFKVFEIDSNADVLYGDMLMYKPKAQPQMRQFASHISLEYIACEGLCHNTSFIKTSLLKEMPYDENYKIVSDRLNFVLWALQDKSFEHIPFVVSNVDMTGISSINNQLLNDEIDLLIERYVPKTIAEDFKIIHDDYQDRQLLTPQVRHFAEIRAKSYAFRKITNMLLKMFK